MENNRSNNNEEEELMQIYEWIDGMTLSRPKKNIARDIKINIKY